MRKPGIAMLARVFDDPAAARAVFEMSRPQMELHEVGAARVRECSHAPPWFDVRLHILNSLDAGLHGVESVGSTKGEHAYYLNTGDRYADTVIYWRGKYRVQPLGDFIERNRVGFK